MKKKITNKDKKDWKKFLDSNNKLENKDIIFSKIDKNEKVRSIDLHGYTLKDANIKIEKFILSCFEKGVTKINIITGKGSRSKNLNDPYQSKDLSILKYSIPNYFEENKNLMNKILRIDYDSVKNSSKGSFDIILKKKSG